MFRPEYEALTEPEQIRFGSAVKLYVLGRVSVADRSASSDRSKRTIRPHCRPSRPPAGGSWKLRIAGLHHRLAGDCRGDHLGGLLPCEDDAVA
jgi:hypothetical protein